MIKRCKICGREFELTAARQAYCSGECRRIGTRLRQKRCRDKQRKAAVTAATVSVDDVLRFAAEYGRRTGHYPHYGEAVKLMEGLEWHT